MARELAAEPGAPRVPGDPELERQAQRLRDGIPVEPGLASLMRDWSARLSIAPPC
jgi:ureidoglycolate dehydrogenase (NAD+)